MHIEISNLGVCVCVCVVCRYAQLNDDQFESLLSGEKTYEELVKPENSKTDNKL